MIRVVIFLFTLLVTATCWAQDEDLPELKWGASKLSEDRILLEWTLSIKAGTQVIYPLENDPIYFPRIELRDSISFRLASPITEDPSSTREMVPVLDELFYVARGNVKYSVIIERLNKNTQLLEGDFVIAVYTPNYMVFHPDTRFVVVWE
jgi:hypothetical protein